MIKNPSTPASRLYCSSRAGGIDADERARRKYLADHNDAPPPGMTARAYIIKEYGVNVTSRGITQVAPRGADGRRIK